MRQPVSLGTALTVLPSPPAGHRLEARGGETRRFFRWIEGIIDLQAPRLAGGACSSR